MKWHGVVLAVAVIALAGCKKKAEDDDDEPGEQLPDVVDIVFEPKSPHQATVSFRVLDAHKQPVAMDAPHVRVKISSGSQRCEGVAHDVGDAAYAGADKRAKVELDYFPSSCDIRGEAKQPHVEVALERGMYSIATGSVDPPRLIFPDTRPVALPELDAELTKLGELATPTWGPPCGELSFAAFAEPTPVEALELNHLVRLTGTEGKPGTKPGPPVYELATLLIHDLDAYRTRDIRDREKLLERVRGIKYVVVSRVGKLVQPELVSGRSFRSGELVADALLIERASGKALCKFPVLAHSSEAVKSDATSDALANDFRGRMHVALADALKAVSPKLQLGAYRDTLRRGIADD